MRLSWRLSAFYFAHFAYAGVVLAYFPLYLASRGLQPAEIAAVVALPQLARIFAPAAWGWLADRSGARRGIVALACAASAAGFAALPWAATPAAIAILVGAMSLVSAAALPLVEAITLGSLAGQAGRYGPIRLWGSVSFIAVVLGGGAWLDVASVRPLPAAVSLFALAALAAALSLPPGGPARRHEIARQPRLAPAALRLLGASACMAIAHGVLYAFFTLHLEREGYSGAAIGAFWTLGVVAEIAVFLRLPALFQRFALSTILAASLLCAVARFLAIGWGAAYLWILVPAQLLHGATFGAFHGASVAAVQHVFPEAAQARGQALLSSIGYGAGGAAGIIAAGWAWEAGGPGAAFSLAAAAAFAGVFPAYRLKRAAF